MENTAFSKLTENGNQYMLNREKNLIRYCPPFRREESEYYQAKNRYLQNFMPSGQIEFCHNLRLSAETIYNKVVNLQQLVFLYALDLIQKGKIRK